MIIPLALVDYYYKLSLSGLCSDLEKKNFKEIHQFTLLCPLGMWGHDINYLMSPSPTGATQQVW